MFVALWFGAPAYAANDLVVKPLEIVTFYSREPIVILDITDDVLIIFPGGESGLVSGDKVIRLTKKERANTLPLDAVRITLPASEIQMSKRQIERAIHDEGKILRVSGLPYINDAGNGMSLSLRMEHPHVMVSATIDDLLTPPMRCDQFLVYRGAGDGENRADPRRWRAGPPWNDFANLNGGRAW